MMIIIIIIIIIIITVVVVVVVVVVVRPHRSNAAYCYKRSSVVCLYVSVSVCLLVTFMSPVKHRTDRDAAWWAPESVH